MDTSLEHAKLKLKHGAATVNLTSANPGSLRVQNMKLVATEPPSFNRCLQRRRRTPLAVATRARTGDRSASGVSADTALRAVMVG